MLQDAKATTYKTSEARCRSMPHPRPFYKAVFFSSLQYLGTIAFLTSVVMCALQPSPFAVKLILGSLVFTALCWLFGFFKRRSAHCPLCKGTPLINTGAHTHVKSFRIPPFSHGTTATLSIIFTHRFRCMYCGSRYDMLKRS
ncbi:MAG: hypothetical protein QM680_06635 [Luteolibacter sp.]